MKRTSRFKTLLAATCFGFALAPFAASAFVINSTTANNATFLVTWELKDGEKDFNLNTNVTGFDISGSALFKYLGSSNNVVNLEITLTNTTANNTEKIGLWRFGFGTDPDVVSVALTNNKINNDDSDKIVSAQLAGGPDNALKVIDVSANTLPGGKKRLLAAEFDTFELALGFDSLDLDSGVTFSPFGAFYQSDKGSYQIGPPDGGSSGGNPVPVPGTLALLGLGFLLARRQLKA